MTSFRYDPKIIADYPNLVGGVILADGLSCPPVPDVLRDAYAAEQEAVKARIGDTPLSELPSLSAWREAFSAFGVSPTQYRSAAESLLRRLTKKGDIPSINTLVDIGNLVSIRYGLPVALFDTREIDLPITVRHAEGDESFTVLGSGEVQQPDPGEVVFVDAKNMAVARRWCWRQSGTSASGAGTTNAVITVEAHHDGGRTDVQRALADLVKLLRTNCGGTFETAVLKS